MKIKRRNMKVKCEKMKIKRRNYDDEGKTG